MKISHSLIVLTSIIFVTGSMLTVGMDLKRTTTNVSTNVTEAKHKHYQFKDAYLYNTKKHEKEMAEKSKDPNAELKKYKMNQDKAMYKLKLESLNKQNTNGSKNKFLQNRKIENASVN